VPDTTLAIELDHAETRVARRTTAKPVPAGYGVPRQALHGWLGRDERDG
jgi:hypothetical protein